MAMRTAHRSLLLLLACAVACRASTPPSQRESAAAGAGWGEVRPIAGGEGGPLAVWAPSIASWGDTLAIVGNRISSGDMVGPGSLAGDVRIMRGRPPALDTLFGLYPRLVVSPLSGIAHLIWAEPEGADSLLWLARGQSLWSATIQPSGEWSRPQRILSGGSVRWAPTVSTTPTFDATGKLHVAVANWSTTGTGVLHLALDGGRWQAREVYSGVTIHTALGVADNGDLAVAWVGHAREGPASSTAAHIVFSQDRGLSWSAPMRLDTATAEASGQLHVVGLHDSFLALWGRYGDASIPLRTVHRAVVRAGSATILRLPTIEPGYPIYGMETARDACGTVHLVVRHLTPGEMHLDYTSLSAGHDTLQHVDTATTVLEADIAVVGGRLTLAWVGPDAVGELKSQVRTRPVLCGRGQRLQLPQELP